MQVGQRVGAWELLSELGRGGFGVVFRARSGPREGALKLLIDPLDAEARLRFEREVRLLSAVEHPGLVRVLDHGLDERGRPWLVMELLEGGSLDARLRQAGPLDPDDATRLGLRLSGALLALHQAGCVHRDLKPQNVLFDAQGAARITDLGLGRSFLPGASRLTATGAVVGTPAYMAPEQIEGQPVGPPADVWALGATLLFALTGRPPFPGGSPLLVMQQVLRESVPRLGAARPELAGHPLEALLGRCLEKDPARRLELPRVRELLDQLLLAPPAAGARRRRGRGLVLGLGLAAVATAFVVQRRAEETASVPPDGPPSAPAEPLGLPDAPPEVVRWLQQADELAGRRQARAALALADRAVERQPELPEAWSVRGNLRRQLGDHAGALADLQRALELNPRLASAWWIRGNVHLDRGELDLASQDLERAIGLAPDAPAPYHLRAFVRQRQGDSAGALADLERCADQSFTGQYTALLLRGGLRRKQDDLPGALADHERALKLGPLEPESWRQRALTRAARGELADALRDLEQALCLAVDPKDQRAAQQDYARVAQAMRAAPVPAGPPAVRARELTRRAEGRLLDKQLAGAEADVDEALRLDPSLARAWLIRGRVRAFDRRREEAARADLREALTRGEDEAAIELGALSLDRSDPARALPYLDQAVQRLPDYWRGRLLRGAALSLLGRPAQGEEDLERASQLAPGRRDVTRLRAELLLRRRQATALPLLESLLLADENDHQTRLLRAQGRLLCMDLPGAREDVERVLAQVGSGDERVGDALRVRGQLRAWQGDRPGARADFARALELEPDALWAADARRRLNCLRPEDPPPGPSAPPPPPDADARALLRDCGALVERGDLQRALVLAEQATHLAQGPLRAQALAALGNLHAVTGRRDRAAAEALEAIALAPNDGRGHAVLGAVLASQEDWQPARVELDRALELGPRQPLTLYHRAEVLAALEHLAEALLDVNESLAQQPDAAEALLLRARLLRNLRRPDEAQADLRRVLELVPAGPLRQRALDLQERLRPR